MNISDRVAALPISTRIRWLRISLGIIYLWFGILKFVPGLSPADGLAKDTIQMLFNGLFSRELSLLMLAIMESAIGMMFLIGFKVRWAVYLALFHMVCTFSPLIFFPDVSYQKPFIFTLVGQYIMKNIVFIAAMLLIFPKKSDT